MDEGVEKKIKIMAIRDDYVNNNILDPDETIAAAVKKRKFLLKRLLEDQGRFPEQLIQTLQSQR